ncbi:hypothetical protein [uncultured Nostoc sp.]|uniref:hypothetical protein n=1 Tax=uncultured Nostoc sp. TaxID=340711 RepID=UPI0035C9DF55
MKNIRVMLERSRIGCAKGCVAKTCQGQNVCREMSVFSTLAPINILLYALALNRV